MRAQGACAGRCHPPVGSVHSGLALLSFLLLQVTGCIWKHFVVSFSLQGFGLNHPEVLLKLQESGCPLHLVKMGTTSGLPEESTETWWLVVTTGLKLGTPIHFPVPQWDINLSISLIKCLGFFPAMESNSNSPSIPML